MDVRVWYICSAFNVTNITVPLYELELRLACKVYRSFVKQNNVDRIGHLLWVSGSKPRAVNDCNFLLIVLTCITQHATGTFCYQPFLNNMRVFSEAGLKVVSVSDG
jgi:hypothetical protein